MKSSQGTAQNEQTRAFLFYLLEHEENCFEENCPMCQTARKIYALINSRSLGPGWPLICKWNEPVRIQ